MRRRNDLRADANWTGRVDRQSRLPGRFIDDDPLRTARGIFNGIVAAAFLWAIILFVGWAAWMTLS